VQPSRKRLTRGKKTLAAAKGLFDLSTTEFGARLSAVERALYLLFNEGYHSASAEAAVRADLCNEAMRLTTLLLEAPDARRPDTYALAALMCLQAARLPARLDVAGDLSSLLDQDRQRWDTQLIADGLALLDKSAAGTAVSSYHLEAAIAAAHATAPSVAATDWDAVVELYDRLMRLAHRRSWRSTAQLPSASAMGPSTGWKNFGRSPTATAWSATRFNPAAIAEFELRRGSGAVAGEYFATAAALARNPAEQRFLEKRSRECQT
jgi:RNA polymerase sigma-70 factor (ECF subfamily)